MAPWRWHDEKLRARVEAACFRRELAFAAKLPNGERVHEQAREALAIPPASWTDIAERERDVDGSREALRHLGAPNWLVRALFAASAWRASRAPRRSAGALGLAEKLGVGAAPTQRRFAYPLRWGAQPATAEEHRSETSPIAHGLSALPCNGDWLTLSGRFLRSPWHEAAWSAIAAIAVSPANASGSVDADCIAPAKRDWVAGPCGPSHSTSTTIRSTREPGKVAED